MKDVRKEEELVDLKMAGQRRHDLLVDRALAAIDGILENVDANEQMKRVGISIVSVRVKDRLDKLNAAAKQKDDAEMKAALAGA